MRIFLVEDEVFALRTLHQKIIDLNQDYEIAGTAKSGAEALPKILETKPAIVLTDIRMQDMDGLTLIQKMQEQNSTAIPVIVSGYQEFEYAKKAMKLGVEHYLLKPVDMNELSDCLESCCQKLKEQYQHQNIHSFLLGEEYFNMDSLSSDSKFLLSYLIFATPLNSAENLLHPVTGYLASNDVLSVFQKAIPEFSFFCFDGICSNEKIILSNIHSDSLETAGQLLQNILPDLTDYFGFPVTCFYGFATTNTLTSQIQSARRGCIRNAIFGTSQSYCTVPSVSPAENLTEFINLLTLLISQKDNKLIHSNLNRLCKKWEKENRTIVACQADLIFILKSLNQNLQKRENIQLDTVFYVQNIYCFCSTSEELASSFAQLLIELFESNKTSEDSSINGEQLVQKMEDYMKKNIAQNLTLQLLADEMNLSKVYLCRIFKKYKNVTPMDYFNHLKMEHACHLLNQFPDISLQKVSDMLGFHDVYYFSKVFKKMIGTSPSAYRNQKK